MTGDYGRALKAVVERTPGGLAGRASATELAELIARVARGELSRAHAREVMDEHLSSGEAVAVIVERRGLRQISDASALAAVVDQVLAANGPAVADYGSGKVQALGFLVGQVMKATHGQANAAIAGAAIRERLGAPGSTGA